MKFQSLNSTKDLQDICSLIDSPEELQLVGPHGEFPLTTERFRETLKARFLPTVGVLNSRIVAFACLTDLIVNENAFIGNVIVSRQHRRKGLGRKLIDYMLNRSFSEFNLTELSVLVYQSNQAALKMYTSAGFKPSTKQPKMEQEELHLTKLTLKKTDYQNHSQEAQ